MPTDNVIQMPDVDDTSPGSIVKLSKASHGIRDDEGVDDMPVSSGVRFPGEKDNERQNQFKLHDEPLLEHFITTGTLRDKLTQIASSQELAQHMESHTRYGLGNWCLEWMHLDEATRAGWLATAERAEKLVMNLDAAKNFKHDMANLDAEDSIETAAHPLLAHAIISFAAKTTPILMADGMPVKAYLPGSDPLDTTANTHAEDIGKALSHQCVTADEYWERGLDTIIHMCGAEGMAYRRKTYDPLVEEFRSEVVSARYVVVSDDIQRLEDAPRISYKFTMPLWRVRQYHNKGYFTNVPYGSMVDTTDPQAIVNLVEQITRLPLVPGSTLEIPVAITIETYTQTVIRITPMFDLHDVDYFPSAIDHTDYAVVHMLPTYTDYHFLPSMFGGFHSFGYGLLLGGMNSAINSILREIIRSAQRYSQDGGLISSRVGLAEDVQTKPGVLQVVEADVADLKAQIMMFDSKPPSSALYQVLGLLQDAGKQLASTVNFSEMSASVSATQIAAMTSQGEQVASSIFRRIRIDMGREFKALLKLNRVYRRKPYSFTFAGEAGSVDAAVFNLPIQVTPTADPKMGSDAKKYAKLQMLLSMMQDPFTDPMVLRQLIWPLMDVSDPEMVKKLIKQPQPDPQLAMDKERLAMDKTKVLADVQEKVSKANLIRAQMQKLGTDLQIAIQQVTNDKDRVRLQELKTQMDTLLKAEEIKLGHKQLAQTHDVSAAKTNGRLSD